MIRRVLERISRDRFAAEDHNVGRWDVVVRDVEPFGPTPWGKRVIDAPMIRGPEDHGYGVLTGAAWDEIKERIDPAEVEPGTVVARITVDLDLWDHRVEFVEGR